MVVIGLPWSTGSKGRRIRYLDDFFGNLRFSVDSLGLLVQKVGGFQYPEDFSGKLMC